MTKTDHVFLPKKERDSIVSECLDLIDDHNYIIHASNFKSRDEYEREVIKIAYIIRSSNGN